MTVAKALKQAPPICQIFCKVIDNYGDFGVCWRLSRQLAAEYGADVIIWLDDFTVLEPWLSAGIPTEDPMFSGNPDRGEGTVRIRPWDEAAPWNNPQQPVDLLIEAFACELPATYIAQILQQPAPLWVNLEYLSAEAWVAGCHGLFSMQPNGLQKLFFFPGFVPGTGGLLRERGIVDRHIHWQSDPEGNRRKVLAELGIGAAGMDWLAAPGSLLISAFTYETPALQSWLQVLAGHEAPVLLLLPPGRLQRSAAVGGESVLEHFFASQAGAAQAGVRGRLWVQRIPFQTQDGYDRLLSVCDLNLVRGEDSFVRAQWAAVPLLWHIYAQKDEAHLNKLQAFLDLYTPAGAVLPAGQPDMSKSLRDFWFDWNQGADCSRSWQSFCSHLPALRAHALRWRNKLLEVGDLSSNLMNFYKNTL